MTKNKDYKYLRSEIIKNLEVALTKSRLKHVMRVEETAIDLAKHYALNWQDASIASLMHDHCKQMEMADQIKLLSQSDYDQGMVAYGDAITHGPAAAVLAKTQYGITKTSIIKAIANHTIGAEEMDDIEKIVYVADYVEPGRLFYDAQIARRLAWHNLDDAIEVKMRKTISNLVDLGEKIYPPTIVIYNYWMDKRKEEFND